MPNTYPPARPKKGHYIVDIRARGTPKDFVLCSCDWRGTTTDYDAHRKVGNRRPDR